MFMDDEQMAPAGMPADDTAATPADGTTEEASE
jgi:hypothetical protein